MTRLNSLRTPEKTREKLDLMGEIDDPSEWAKHLVDVYFNYPKWEKYIATKFSEKTGNPIEFAWKVTDSCYFNGDVPFSDGLTRSIPYNDTMRDKMLNALKMGSLIVIDDENNLYTVSLTSTGDGDKTLKVERII